MEETGVPGPPSLTLVAGLAGVPREALAFVGADALSVLAAWRALGWGGAFRGTTTTGWWLTDEGLELDRKTSGFKL